MQRSRRPQDVANCGTDDGVPHPDVLAGSDIMGDDGIDLRRLHDQSDEADERHPIDVEIRDEALWVQPVDMTLQGLRERLRTTTLNP